MTELKLFLEDTLSNILPQWLAALILSLTKVILWVFIGKVLILITKKTVYK